MDAVTAGGAIGEGGGAFPINFLGKAVPVPKGLFDAGEGFIEVAIVDVFPLDGLPCAATGAGTMELALIAGDPFCIHE